jgi:hypothetical protein
MSSASNKILSDFIPGDLVEGTKNEFYKTVLYKTETVLRNAMTALLVNLLAEMCTRHLRPYCTP